jgi:hypothetical protein
MSIATESELTGATTVISQPMFLPWRGMFEQIKLADDFVFYDDVQLPLGGGRGRGFSTRVQIKTHRGAEWMNVPVVRAGHGRQLINQARFAGQDWRRQHLERLRQAYREAPFFKQVHEPLVQGIYAIETDSLSEFCMRSTRLLAEALGLQPRWHVSSQMDYERCEDASERVVIICEQFNAACYVSGLGAMNYLNYELFEQAGIQVRYMDYKPITYSQLHGDFTPYVSLLDMLYSIGPDQAAQSIGSPATHWRDWPFMHEGRPMSRPQ